MRSRRGGEKIRAALGDGSEYGLSIAYSDEGPAPLETGGRWAVQIGSFAAEKDASEVADHLTRRYRTAKVLRFASPVGDWWVRVRVLDDNRERAQTLARETQTSEGSVFLVRLD